MSPSRSKKEQECGKENKNFPIIPRVIFGARTETLRPLPKISSSARFAQAWDRRADLWRRRSKWLTQSATLKPPKPIKPRSNLQNPQFRLILRLRKAARCREIRWRWRAPAMPTTMEISSSLDPPRPAVGGHRLPDRYRWIHSFSRGAKALGVSRRWCSLYDHSSFKQFRTQLDHSATTRTA